MKVLCKDKNVREFKIIPYRDVLFGFKKAYWICRHCFRVWSTIPELVNDVTKNHTCKARLKEENERSS